MTNDAYILGFASEKPFDSASASWYDTHIGGLPIWPPALEVAIPDCPLCDAKRVLVLQAYAPHRNHPERLVCVFGCNSIQCSANMQAWWAVRVCRVQAKRGPAIDLAEGSAGVAQVSAEEEEIQWDTDSESDNSSNEVGLVKDLGLLSLEVELATARKAASASGTPAKPFGRRSPSKPLKRAPSKPLKRGRHGTLNASKATGGKEGSLHSVPISTSAPPINAPPNRETCASYYVEVDYEPQEAEPLVEESSIDALLQQYKDEEHSRAVTGTIEEWTAEREDDDETAGLRNQEDFRLTIARAPSQILRYKFGGKPLWPSHPAPQLDRNETCECGAPLMFELQLLGSSLHYLKPEESVPQHQEEAGMNFASIAIFTCENDCTEIDTAAENDEFKVLRQKVCIQQDDW